MTKSIEQYIQKAWTLTISFNRTSGTWTINCGLYIIHGSSIEECLKKLEEEIEKNNSTTT